MTQTGSDAVHRAAAAGYMANADSYVRGRPDYPPELAGWLTGALGLEPGASVVDLGAGTGKFTPRLVDTGASVIAVEPVDSMRGKLATALPNVRALKGTAQALPLDDASVDAVVCAQSFHWFASRDALSEIHRVLKPGGRLGLVWNLRDARVPWVARLDEIVNRHEGDTPRYYTGAWRSAFPHPGFGPLKETHFSLGHTGSPEDVIVHRVRSTSFVAALPEDARERIDAELRALIESEPELRGKKAVTVPYETAAFIAIKESA
ncbi:class I SAM-dependent methyltransferase [Caballeronia sp. Lep1P3]|uniref:class I SAM-dependent methyltransferase n=1 Tax=Caballeronia sp. Lep1P3 TaxID=2878150 RepID=UPI001FD60D08|nr:class I SAM-dependent methyltransferase [Caballeronia sp. Lep1P3]